MFDTPDAITASAAPAHMRELFGIFGEANGEVPQCDWVAPEDVPEIPRRLLAHDKHMTVTLETFHDAPVNVSVLRRVRMGNHYAREIALSNSKTGQYVLYGIMRFNFKHCSDEVRDKILEEKTPLGRILIEHNVLRSVSTLALVKIKPTARITELFKMRESRPVYGRFATIFCNGEPAVDLLEVVPER